MAYEFPQLNKEELKALEKETLPFYKKRTLRDGQEVKTFQYNEFMRFKRAMRFDGVYWSICELSSYMKLDNALEQLSKYRSKIAYAKRKELERLAAGAGQ